MIIRHYSLRFPRVKSSRGGGGEGIELRGEFHVNQSFRTVLAANVKIRLNEYDGDKRHRKLSSEGVCFDVPALRPMPARLILSECVCD